MIKKKLDYKIQNEIRTWDINIPLSVLSDLKKSIKSKWINTGPREFEFRNLIKKRFQCKFAVATNSGTSSLRAALAALNVGPGDEVISTPYTWLATNTAILEQGAKPVFADINYDDLNISVKDIESKITKKTKAIICVHFAGNSVDLDELNEIGKKLYEQKAFGAAAAVFEAAVSVPTSKNFLIDNFYLGNALYYDNTGKDADKRDKIALQKADVAFGNVITASPTTQDAYIFRARTNKLLENDQQMSDYYQQYIDVVSAKGEEEITKNKTKFIEAYNNMASHYANSDKAKARELLNKTLTIDPTNSYALESLKLLK